LGCQANSGQANRRFGSRKPVNFFFRTHNETLSVAAMRVGNPDRSLVKSIAETFQLQPALLRLS
jgi:hypothetical protein